jgi:hypothetical protein
MEQADWQGFGIRLGRAIDRWPGGGQRAFVKELAAHATRSGIAIPKSYRTLVNYLNGTTRPSSAWVAAAADVLGQPAEWLLAGVESRTERPDDWAGVGVQAVVTADSAPRAEALVHLILDGYLDLPWEARLIMHGAASFFFAHDTEGWEDRQRRREDVAEFVQTYFGPLRQPLAAKMGEVAIMSLASSLAASAYLQLDGEKLIQNRRGLDPAEALADLKRRQPPNELDVAELERRIAQQGESTDA